MADRIEITVLSDNNAQKGLRSEHGFSVLIKTDGGNVLFDTGRGDVFLHNAGVLGVELNEIEFLVLSHGHYDHTGGIPAFTEVNKTARICFHPSVLLPRYALKKGEKPRSIGIPSDPFKTLNSLEKDKAILTESLLEIIPGLTVTGKIPRQTDFEDVGGNFYLDEKGETKDPIDDDQALIIEKGEDIVLIVGCSHAGIINTIEYVEKLKGRGRIKAVIGGFHLVNAGDDRIEKTVSYLDKSGIDIIAPCHCTGSRAMDMLKRGLRDRIKPCMAGKVFNF